VQRKRRDDEESAAGIGPDDEKQLSDEVLVTG
jgi:hypothetical protein